MPGINHKKRNYYLKNKSAYTEDHVLVKSLFLVYIPQQLEHTHLRKYFQKFGRITRLQVFNGNGRQNRSSAGYVNFANPRHAAKVLQQKVHFINGRRLSIQPSDSWHQPDSRATQQKVDPNEPPAAIFNLNDHCLEHILSKLPLIDRIHFARTCNRFRNVYLGMSPSLDKSIKLDLFETMTIWDIRDFFQLSGKHVKKIEGFLPQQHSKRLCDYLGLHCVNLQTMTIMANKLSQGNLNQLFANVKSLQTLELRGCNLTNECLNALGKLGQLKTLDLSDNNRLTGGCVQNLPDSIETLTLNHCYEMLPNKSTCSRLFGKLKHLKELHAKSVRLHQVIQDMVNDKLCESLEVLTISCIDSKLQSDYKHIAQLPSLKKLTVFIPDNEVPPMLFEWLVQYKSQQLEYLKVQAKNSIGSEQLVAIGKLSSLRSLHLPNNISIVERNLESLYGLQNLEEINLVCCDNLTDSGVLRLILACPKLQVLHLAGCEMLSDILIQNLLSKLKNNPTKRPLPIKLHMLNDVINSLMLTNPEVAAKNIIEVLNTLPSETYFDYTNIMFYDDMFGPDRDEDDFLEDEDYFDSDFDDDDDFFSDDDDFLEFVDFGF